MLNRRDIEMMKQPPTRSFDPAILQARLKLGIKAHMGASYFAQ